MDHSFGSNQNLHNDPVTGSNTSNIAYEWLPEEDLVIVGKLKNKNAKICLIQFNDKCLHSEC